MPLINPNQVGGAAPAMGNPNKTPTLPPQAMAKLRQDPEVIAAVTKYVGKPVPLQMVPDNLLLEIAGMVAKLGVDGAVAEFSRKVPQQAQAQLKAAAAQGGGMAPQGMPPR